MPLKEGIVADGSAITDKDRPPVLRELTSSLEPTIL